MARADDDPPDADGAWTVGPAFAWFVGFAVVGLLAIDGNVQALADRLTAKRAPAAAPTAGGAPAPVADAPDAPDEPAAKGSAAEPSLTGGDRAKTGALEDTCVDGTPAACKRWAMDGFYQALADEQSGKLGRAVRVSWYGDSVVATDAIPGRLRTRMHQAFGDGGPGYVFVVPPHRFCGHEAITRSSGGTWQPHAISTMQAPDGLYGAGGSSAETPSGGDGRATIKLVAGKVARAELYYLAQPSGGTVTVKADGAQVLEADTKADAKEGRYASAAIDAGAAKFELTTTGRVRVFGLDLENAKGAVVDNLGIVSVNAKSFDNTNAEHFQAELAHRSSDLVLIMIGANEAQWLGPGDRDTKDYAAHYGKVLAPFRKARPDASCLVVSPTDQAEAKDGAYPSRPVMPLLVEAQRQAARAAGCAFFSTYDWMGGKGSAEKWFRHGLVGTDFQHLTRKGANKFADAVFDTLVAGAKKYAPR
jgi:lysophospholipase L1-like esterase